jgi:hypothetical protein
VLQEARKPNSVGTLDRVSCLIDEVTVVKVHFKTRGLRVSMVAVANAHQEIQTESVLPQSKLLESTSVIVFLQQTALGQEGGHPPLEGQVIAMLVEPGDAPGPSKVGQLAVTDTARGKAVAVVVVVTLMRALKIQDRV